MGLILNKMARFVFHVLVKGWEQTRGGIILVRKRNSGVYRARWRSKSFSLCMHGTLSFEKLLFSLLFLGLTFWVKGRRPVLSFSLVLCKAAAAISNMHTRRRIYFVSDKRSNTWYFFFIHGSWVSFWFWWNHTGCVLFSLCAWMVCILFLEKKERSIEICTNEGSYLAIAVYSICVCVCVCDSQRVVTERASTPFMCMQQQLKEKNEEGVKARQDFFSQTHGNLQNDP